MMLNTIYDMLRSAAEISPHHPVLIAPGRQPLDYANLLAQVDRTRQELANLGINRHDPLAIVLPNGQEMAVAFLSIASYAISAPLNPAYTAADFEFYLKDLNAAGVIVLAGWESPVRTIARRLEIPVLELHPANNPAIQQIVYQLSGDTGRQQVRSILPSPDDPALILHTSGTTSRPKMVPLTQRNLMASAANVSRMIELTSDDCCLNIMPLFHIHGLVAALLASLYARASVVCTPGLDTGQFYIWMDEFRPTWYTAVPTMHQAILALAGAHLDILRRVRLRLIRSSSASLPPPVMAGLEKTFECPVIEAYGMTEAAHQIASNPLPPLQRKPGSVGPAAGPDVAIMDGSGVLLATGQPGEVVIRGANVTAGYANNPGANTGAFSSGWFRTGDRGYLDSDGYLHITGRLKEMINRGGEKITPREVDEVFLEHPSVEQAVTFAIPHPTLGEDVAVAVVLNPLAPATAKDLRQFAFERLAAYKVPSQIVVVSKIPVGPTGKLMRIGLYEKLVESMQTTYKAPTTDTEIDLTAIWEQLLQRSPIGVNDNFFYLGGDSLLATQLTARLQAALKINLSAALVFREPTVAELADAVEAQLQAEIDRLSDEEVRNLL